MAKYYGEDRRIIHGAADLTEHGLSDQTNPVSGAFNANGYAGYTYIGKPGETLSDLLTSIGDEEFQNDADNYFYKVIADTNGFTGQDNITDNFQKATNTVLGTGRSQDNALDTADTKVIYGFTGDDTITTIGDNRIVYAGEDNDTVYANGGNGKLDGGSGNDLLTYQNVTGEVGVSINFSSQTAGIIGGAVVDHFSHFESVAGSAYADSFQGSTGNDALDGGDGVDTVSFAGGAAVVVNLGTGAATGQGTDSLAGIEHVVGSSHADIITGGAGDDKLTGGAGNDNLNGGLGVDTFDFSGAYGKDVVTDGDAVSSLIIDGETIDGTATFDFTAKHWVLEEHPDYYLTRSGADMVLHKTGDAANNVTLKDFAMGESRYGIDIPLITFEYRTRMDASSVGGSATAPFSILFSFNPSLPPVASTFLESDYALVKGLLTVADQTAMLEGGVIGVRSFEDPFITNPDYYRIEFGSSNATLFGETIRYAQFEIVDWQGAAFTSTALPSSPGFAGAMDYQFVDVGLGTQDPTHVLRTIEDSITPDSNKTPFQLILAGDPPALLGTSGDDTLAGGAGADTVLGGGGADSISGNGGADALNGGGSNDTINGGSGDDSLEGGAENDSLLGGSGNDALLGQDGNDYLSGNAGSDTLIGGSGDDNLLGDTSSDTVGGADILIGGEGKDTMAGGVGVDIFTFLSLADSTETTCDRIKDFQEGIDKIDLTGLGYTGVVLSGADAGELRLTYSAVSNRTYVRDDYSPFEFYLEGNHTATLHDSDFIFA